MENLAQSNDYKRVMTVTEQKIVTTVQVQDRTTGQCLTTLESDATWDNESVKKNLVVITMTSATNKDCQGSRRQTISSKNQYELVGDTLRLYHSGPLKRIKQGDPENICKQSNLVMTYKRI